MELEGWWEELNKVLKVSGPTSPKGFSEKVQTDYKNLANKAREIYSSCSQINLEHLLNSY